MARKLRTRKHRVILNRSAGGDIGISMFMIVVGAFMFLPMFYAVLQSLKPHLDARQTELTERVILEREYELLEIEGRAEEQLRPPYDAIYRAQSRSYKLKHFLKRSLPGLHRIYRKRRGYSE